jgi:hypothetical protein
MCRRNSYIAYSSTFSSPLFLSEWFILCQFSALLLLSPQWREGKVSTKVRLRVLSEMKTSASFLNGSGHYHCIIIQKNGINMQ